MHDIRPLSDHHLDDIRLLEAYTGHYAWGDSAYAMAFRARWPVVGYFVGGGLQGVLVYQLAGDQCSLLNVVVGQAYLGRGLARALIEYMIQVAEQAGCDSVFLEVREDNRAAINLYESLGFSVINTRPGYYHYQGQAVTGLDMALPLGVSDSYFQNH